jgi:divalent metal cation (Fe/Co/Zn/Cd) transporter
VNYAVLGASFIFEGVSWAVAYREFRKAQDRRTPFRMFSAVRQSKDPTLFTVLFEDSAALLGLLAATIGVMAAHLWNVEWSDAAASLIISAILAAAAILLAQETKGLLIGEAASKSIVSGIRQIVRDAPEILTINELRTLHLAPHEILLALRVDFADGLSSQRVERSVSQLERKIKDRYPQVTRVFIEVQGKAPVPE